MGDVLPASKFFIKIDASLVVVQRLRKVTLIVMDVSQSYGEDSDTLFVAEAFHKFHDLLVVVRGTPVVTLGSVNIPETNKRIGRSQD